MYQLSNVYTLIHLGLVFVNKDVSITYLPQINATHSPQVHYLAVIGAETSTATYRNTAAVDDKLNFRVILNRLKGPWCAYFGENEFILRDIENENRCRWDSNHRFICNRSSSFYHWARLFVLLMSGPGIKEIHQIPMSLFTNQLSVHTVMSKNY